jgi:protocatechuate 3,4-dioxygenase alpha subunit
VEIWQADAAGRYDSPDDPRSAGVNDKSFIGFGRASTSMEGVYRFRTIRPGTIPFPGGGMQAPHIALGVMGRGLLKRLVTRLYFEGAPENDADPVLALVPAARRATLIARKDPTARKDGDAWRMDIVLQGEGETVFFDC